MLDGFLWLGGCAVGSDGASLVEGPPLAVARGLRGGGLRRILLGTPPPMRKVAMARRVKLADPEPSSFQPTVWTMIDRAKSGDTGARAGVYVAYRRPVVRFLEKRLPSGPLCDAEALADDVMMGILNPRFLAQADRAKGRFRDLLLAVTR